MWRAFQANVHPCVTLRGVCRLTLLPLGLDGNCSCGKLSSLYALKTEVLFCLIWLVSVDCDGIAWVCKWKIFFLFHMPVSPRVSCFSSLSLAIFCSWPLVVPRGIFLLCGMILIFPSASSSCFITPLGLSLELASLSPEVRLRWPPQVSEVS